MTCKINHTDPDEVPAYLCRVCNPGKYKPTPAPVRMPLTPTDSVAAQTEKFEKRQARKLRAEAKRLQGQIDMIAGRNPPATAKIQAALDLVNRDLYLVC
jgi:hypothetical protein